MMNNHDQRTASATCLAPAVTRPFRTPVRGHAFAARTPATSDPVPGQLARLVREPTNPADRYAVGVWVAGRGGRWRIGYLDRLIAARLAPRLDAGATIAARIDGWTPEPDGRWRRPLLVLLPQGETGSDVKADDPPSNPETASGEREQGVVATRAELWGRPPGVSRRVLRSA
jgi:hypothetical protein